MQTKATGLDLWEGEMPHRTQITTPQILHKMALRHAVCTRAICESANRLSGDEMNPEDAAAYARLVCQTESVARFLRTPVREYSPDDKSPHSLQSGLTGVFLKEDDAGDFFVEEHCMSNTSSMHDLLNKPLGASADGWTLIAIKF